MGSICSLGSEKECQHRIPSYHSIEDLHFSTSLFVQENFDSFSSVYSICPSVLGYGSYGEVFLCEHLRSNEKRAVKIIKKSLIRKFYLKKKEILNETIILKNLDHPNILKIFEYFEDEKKFYIVMEYCKDGDLLGELERVGKVNEETCARIMRQLMAGVAYIHGKSIVHRDLKLENVLISRFNDEISIKIIDFNVATYLKDKKLTSVAGTAHYMAPEILQNSYDEQCDIWSCGVIMYVLLSHTFPFTGSTQYQIFQSISDHPLSFPPSIWSQISSSAKDLISNLLEKSPTIRYSAIQSLNHPFILSVIEQQRDRPMFQRTLTRMRTVIKKPKLKEMFETFLLGQVQKNDPRIEVFEKVFFEMDVDGNGVISKKDILAKLFEELGEYDDKEADRILSAIDNNGSGEIDFSEFLRVALEDELLVCKENLRKAFYYFDKNKSDSIDKNEIFDWLSDGAVIPMEVIEKLIEDADKNKDGVIDLEEFENMLISRIQQEENEEDSSDLEL